MITEKGKQIIGKYLIGQTSSFANYVAIGCGVEPVQDTGTVNARQFSIDQASRTSSVAKIVLDSTNANIKVGDRVVITGLTSTVEGLNSSTGHIVTKVSGGNTFYFASTGSDITNVTGITTGYCYVMLSVNENLYFEMERFPIVTKSFYRDPDDGKMKLIFKAELPSEQRYKITEVGLFPTKYDQSNSTGDNKKIAVFLSKEGWRRVNPDPATQFDSLITLQAGSIEQEDGSVSVNNGVAFVTDSNAAWAQSSRMNRNEVPRFLTESLLVDGFYSDYDGTYTSGDFSSTAAYIQNPSIFLNLSQNTPDDEVKIAASVVPKAYTTTNLPDYVAFKIEFSNQTSSGDQKRAYAIIRKNFSNTNNTTGADLDTNYFVISTTIGDFIKQDADFSWANITGIKIWVYADNASSNTTADYFVLLDGMRIDAVNRTNTLYGMIAHNVVVTGDGTPILKKENTSSYIEFKLDLGE